MISNGWLHKTGCLFWLNSHLNKFNLLKKCTWIHLLSSKSYIVMPFLQMTSGLLTWKRIQGPIILIIGFRVHSLKMMRQEKMILSLLCEVLHFSFYIDDESYQVMVNNLWPNCYVAIHYYFVLFMVYFKNAFVIHTITLRSAVYSLGGQYVYMCNHCVWEVNCGFDKWWFIVSW